jgi:hypothetical protein
MEPISIWVPLNLPSSFIESRSWRFFSRVPLGPLKIKNRWKNGLNSGRLRTFIILFDLTVTVVSASPFSFLHSIFYAYSSDSEVFRAHRNDRYGFLENDVASKWSWKLTTSIFFVGMMTTIILPGMEVEVGGG